MEKRSPRLTHQTEKSQINCMWRLMSSFYFGKNHRKQKLLSNGKNAAKHVMGTENERKIDSLTYFNHQLYDYEDGAEVEDFGLFDQLISKYRPSSKKGCKNESPLYDRNETETGSFDPDSGSAELSISKLRLESKLEAICNQIHQENGDSQRSTKNDQLEEINLQLLQMSAKAFLDQMFIDRKYNRKCGVSYESERFSDALDMLNSNGDLFLKHLQDPNSLLTKQIRNLQNLQMARESVKSLLNNKLSGDDQSCDTDMWKSKKKSYRSAYSSKEISSTPPSNKIVVLKPTPRTVRCSENVSCHCSSMQSHYSTGSKGKNVKSKNFSLKDVKRKLKYATGEKLKDKHRLTITGAVNTFNEINTKNRAEKRQESISSDQSPKVTVLTETVQKKLDVSAISYSKQRELDIFLEAKKHLYQRLRTVNTVEAVMSRQPSRTLGGILSSPEHDLSINSPKMDSNNNSVQMRISPFGIYQMAEAEVHRDIICYAKGDLKHNDTSILESPPEPAITGVQSPQKNEDRRHMKSSMDSPTQVWTPDSSTDVSSTSPSSNYKLRVVENTLDRQDYLSPVSVLDSIFTNDLASPSGTANQPSDNVLQPRCIDFEECSYNESPHCPVSNCSVVHIAELDALGIHIQSNLQTLHSNWEQLWVNSPRQEQMLRATLFDDLLESSALECHCDPQLLMDYTYEVLLEVYYFHFRFPPWLSFLQPKIQPFPLEEYLLEKVMKQVRQHLVPVMEQPTLDQLVGHDLAKTDSWLDIRSDIEDVLTQIVDRVLQESILDTVLQLHTPS